jgi:hypothetical protein
MDISSSNRIDSSRKQILSIEASEKTKDSVHVEGEEEEYINGDDLNQFFELNGNKLQQVLEEYHSLKENHPDSTIASRESYADLVNNWVPLELDNGKLYVSRYCELQKRWILADSMLIRFFQDGPAPSLILEVKKEHNEYRMKTTWGPVYFKLIDAKREIYSFKDDYAGNIYVIPVDRIKNFPVMFHECDTNEE